ncbi:hypothetical protein OI19_22890, partial [Salmonella enterica subsp. enterica serovar Enteritidis]|nr:hypothetical protein [Salmonella enterica subsp. enterica serovar Enteritidis]
MKVQTLEFPYGEVEFTRDEYIDASTLTIQMNRWRTDNGLQRRNLAQILKTDDCKDFMRVCEEETGIVPLKTTRGRNGKTWLSLHLAVYIAEQYSTYFHFLVIDRFITQ